jgi:serine/threonine-protein kinase
MNMVVGMSRCNESRLKSLLDDELPELEQADLSDHLETCASCRRTLERLAAGSQLWSDLRQLGPGRNPVTHSASQVDPTAFFGTSLTGGGEAERDRALEFLAASDSPGSLGRLGQYEVTELLGRGGFGVVLKAFEPALGRVVAIKVLDPQLATSASARSRFAREARAAAAVVHEHVVAIHAVDSWNKLPYLVMPFVAGQSLQERVDRDGPLGAKEVLRIGIQTASGLAAAHAQGLVHRDVKPSNILLENGVERVRLTDFGLARAVDDASLTQSGVIAGTPQYMSPEQARGEAVDHRSDLFSLGSVLYFMCAGHPPFRASSTPAVLRRVSDDQPRPVRQVNLDVPDWLAATVERLHAKDPSARYQSAAEVAQILERYLAELQRGTPIVIQSAVPAVRDRRRGRKSVVAAACSIPAMALALLAFGKPSAIATFVPAFGPPAAGALKPADAKISQERNVVIVRDNDDNKLIVGSGNPATKTWDIAGFDRIQITSTFHAEIMKGSSFKVSTVADDNILAHIQAVKDGTTLKIGLAQGSYRLKSPLEAAITLPSLAGLDMSGASKGTLKGFNGERAFALKLSGASQLSGSIVAGSTDLEINGASTVVLSGSADRAHLAASGSSRLKLAEFLLKQGEVTLDGASNAQLSVQTDAPFTARLSGASRLSGSVQAKALALELSGASHVALDGKADDAKIHASGASGFKLPGMITQTAEVNLSGASSGTVDARVDLKYDLSSASSLRYIGNPSTLKGTKAGGSSISRQK